MPKKRQDRVLLIKPGSSSSSIATPRRDAKTTASVNDLIREARKLQVTTESNIVPTTSSIPPALREVLNLPLPSSPAPRPGARSNGPVRLRRIPGPPPPRSWLKDSIHAPATAQNEAQYEAKRLHKATSTLPGVMFPTTNSLMHVALKRMATDWAWHVEYDHGYIAALPVYLKELLLSYIAIYSEHTGTNPLRLLFPIDEDIETRNEVTRLDLGNGIGMWTNVRQIERDLCPAKESNLPLVEDHDAIDSWDTSSIGLVAVLNPVGTFDNLRHLSLALSPGHTASWKDLIRLASKVSTITSLSLAYWPQPTYTPVAASTRAIVKQSQSSPGVVYGGSNFYTAFDNDWREVAGILRTLSRSLYCLKWIDLTGCGNWWSALVWSDEDEMAEGPEWNGSWRGIEYICLDAGWTPVSPDPVMPGTVDPETEAWDVELRRQQYRYKKDLEERSALQALGFRIAKRIRSMRKAQAGKWIDFRFGEVEKISST